MKVVKTSVDAGQWPSKVQIFIVALSLKAVAVAA